jgi:hypothetical protein
MQRKWSGYLYGCTILHCTVSLFIASLALASEEPQRDIDDNNVAGAARMLELGSRPAPLLSPTSFNDDALAPSSKLSWASYSAGQGPSEIDAPTPSEAPTVAGTTLVHFGKVGDGVYKGSKPKTDADYEFLQTQHIKYILDLELLLSLGHSEQKKAKRHGIVLLHARINASPISPSEKRIERILAVLKDSRHHPIYFHCAYGRDRTSLVAALYKVYFLGMSPQDALRYMDESGYKEQLGPRRVKEIS